MVIVFSRLLKHLYNWTMLYTESTLGKLLDLSKRSCFCFLWIYKCPFFYILFLATIYVNYWTQNVKKPVNAGLICIIQIPHSQRQTIPFRGQNVPTPEKVGKGPPFSFFIQNAPIDVKLSGGRQGMGHGEGIFTALDRGTQWLNVSKPSEVYQMVFYKR